MISSNEKVWESLIYSLQYFCCHFHQRTCVNFGITNTRRLIKTRNSCSEHNSCFFLCCHFSRFSWHTHVSTHQHHGFPTPQTDFYKWERMENWKWGSTPTTDGSNFVPITLCFYLLLLSRPFQNHTLPCFSCKRARKALSLRL